MDVLGLLVVASLLAAVSLAVVARWLWLRVRAAEDEAARGTRLLDAIAGASRKVGEAPDRTTGLVFATLAREGFADPAVFVLDEPTDRWVRRTDAGEERPVADGVVAETAQRSWDTDAPVVVSAAPDRRALIACPIPGDGSIRAVLVAWEREASRIGPREAALATAAAGLLGVGGPLPPEDSATERGRGDARPSGPVDNLTGLGTPSSFSAALERRCRERGAPVALLLVSLDGVESVAQELGWRSSEEVVRIAARRLRRSLRPDDAIARIEALLFGVLLADATEPEAAVAVARRALHTLEGPVAVTGGEVRVEGRAAMAWDATTQPEPGRLLPDAKEALSRAGDDVATAVRVGETTTVSPGPG